MIAAKAGTSRLRLLSTPDAFGAPRSEAEELHQPGVTRHDRGWTYPEPDWNRQTFDGQWALDVLARPADL
jgi:hypothetical protein